MRYDYDLKMGKYMGYLGQDEPGEIVLPVETTSVPVSIPDMPVVINVGTEDEPVYETEFIEPGEEVLRRSIEAGYDPFSSYKPAETDLEKLLKTIALPVGVAAAAFALIQG